MSIGVIILLGVVAILTTSIALKWMEHRRDLISKSQEHEARLKELEIEKLRVKYSRPRGLIEALSGFKEEAELAIGDEETEKSNEGLLDVLYGGVEGDETKGD